MHVKSLLQYRAVPLLIVAVLCLSNFNAFAQKTAIWLVRHAEKSTNDASAKDPVLSAAGIQRAADLAQVLSGQSINHIYSTPYKRTLQTVQRLAMQRGLTPVIYDANEAGAIAAKVVEENKGRSCLIVGHSNTILPIIKALNCPTPFDELNDSDYDMLFRVTIDDKGQARLSISHYGQAHHTTPIPAEYKSDHR